MSDAGPSGDRIIISSVIYSSPARRGYYQLVRFVAHVKAVAVGTLALTGKKVAVGCALDGQKGADRIERFGKKLV